MTCKDCIHYVVCDRCPQNNREVYAPKSRYIELPCAVGDTVYSFIRRWKIEDGIAPYQITNIAISQNKKGVWTKKYRAMRINEGKTIDWQINFCFEEIGKTVFLSLAEAEKELSKEKHYKDIMKLLKKSKDGDIFK